MTTRFALLVLAACMALVQFTLQDGGELDRIATASPTGEDGQAARADGPQADPMVAVSVASERRRSPWDLPAGSPRQPNTSRDSGPDMGDGADTEGQDLAEDDYAPSTIARAAPRTQPQHPRGSTEVGALTPEQMNLEQ